ncbi:MAG: hypothetical protein AB7V46_10775 [Thermomicrobiales bacterium]
MIFAPYRNVLDLAHEVNGSEHRQQLSWDEIDFELGGSLFQRVRTVKRRVRIRLANIDVPPRRERHFRRDQLEPTG